MFGSTRRSIERELSTRCPLIALNGDQVSHVFLSCLVVILSRSGMNIIFSSPLILGVMSMRVLFLKRTAWNSASRKLCILLSQIVQPNTVFSSVRRLSFSQLLKQKEGIYFSDLFVNLRSLGRSISPMFLINSLIDKLTFFGVVSFTVSII